MTWYSMQIYNTSYEKILFDMPKTFYAFLFYYAYIAFSSFFSDFLFCYINHCN
jgi:hypothetical protein